MLLLFGVIVICSLNFRTYDPNRSSFSSTAPKDPLKAEVEKRRIETNLLKQENNNLKKDLASESRRVKAFEELIEEKTAKIENLAEEEKPTEENEAAVARDVASVQE